MTLQIKIFFYVRGKNESHFLTVQRNNKFLSDVQIWSACADTWKMIEELRVVFLHVYPSRYSFMPASQSVYSQYNNLLQMGKKQTDVFKQRELGDLMVDTTDHMWQSSADLLE